MAENRVCNFCEQSAISDKSGDVNDMIPCSICGDFCKFMYNMCGLCQAPSSRLNYTARRGQDFWSGGGVQQKPRWGQASLIFIESFSQEGPKILPGGYTSAVTIILKWPNLY
jgi:hypothetical protein